MSAGTGIGREDAFAALAVPVWRRHLTDQKIADRCRPGGTKAFMQRVHAVFMQPSGGMNEGYALGLFGIRLFACGEKDAPGWGRSGDLL